MLMKFGQFMSYYKKKKKKRKKKENSTKPQKLRPLCLQRIKHNLYWKMKLLKQATYIRYVLVKLSKFVQISTQIPFYGGFFEN